MANFDFEGLLSNPAFQMGLGILGNNNTENTAQVLGRGGLMGLQNYQQQKQRDDFNKIRQSQVDVMKQRQDREDSELEMQKQVIAEASAKFPDQALLFQLDPQAAVKALYPQANQADPFTDKITDENGNVYLWNRRETDPQKALTPFMVDGKPFTEARYSPNLLGGIEYSKEYSKARATPTDMEPGVIQKKSDIIDRLNNGLPSDVPRLPQGQPQSNAWQIPPEVQAQRDMKAKELIAAEGGQGDLGVTPPVPYKLPRGGGIRVPTKAEEAAAVESAKLSAKNSVEAQAEVPLVVDLGNEAVQLVDDLIKHKGFEKAVGTSSLNPLNKIPGTDANDFNIRLDQIKGKQFLQAFETLKGGGQITEIEGKKATDAISRMNPSASEEEFKKAAQEFKEVIMKGMERAKNKAGVSSSNNSSPKAGDVVDGYRFKGGNPADPNNWEE